ncbi:alpha/beta hydrolase family protein [Alteromonas sp. AMM-1]|uniref:alpha/beta hydrolase family protein n=1 Tax=Alteromonas sp. AMM-1 TaxID=3394233 RepID=UPI0039A7036D
MKAQTLILLFALFTALATQADDTLDVKDFHLRPAVETAKLNPSGNLIAYEKFGDVFVGNEHVPFSKIYGVNNWHKIHTVSWISDSILAIQTRNNGSGKIGSHFFDLLIQEHDIKVVRKDYIDNQGYIVDRLPMSPENIYFGQYRWNDDGHVYADVHKVPLFSETPYRFNKNQKLNSNSGKIIEWITDQSSLLQVGMSYEDNLPHLWGRKSKRSNKMELIWTGNADTYFNVYGVDPIKRHIWVITDFERDRRAAVVFDLETATVNEVLYEHPNRDVNGIVMDANGEKPLAVTFIDKGRLDYYFLNDEANAVLANVKQHAPAFTYAVYDTSPDFASMLVVKFGQSEPGVIMHCKQQGTDCSPLVDLYPWLDHVQLSTMKVLQTPTTGDLNVESFISFPANADLNTTATLPLVIMPHGGPIGIYDAPFFSSDVEWLAYNGYAVLRVNYRGSGGYGRNFEESGMQQWGRAIERDINAAVEDVLKKYPVLNANRMCLFGASYGGYSSIMGVIQHPDKYKCAVSFAGVTDLPLLFNKRSVQNNETLTQILKEMIGDPASQMTELMAYSPVYNADKVERPVLLIHGTKDSIVDIEHSWRLSRMLSFYNKPHELKIMRGAEHSFDTTGEVKIMYDWVMPFLAEHLKEEVPPTETTSVKTQ